MNVYNRYIDNFEEIVVPFTWTQAQLDKQTVSFTASINQYLDFLLFNNERKIKKRN